ncbi:DUF6879 family protein [Streptomonospora wellingtoniae]|uniref:DUF6879 domain-containing protein n=1 Tax=Streptomonospora wellingtoniae TaxID=3075544 RepID=A0ABU2L0H2_9ACTN|nr:DUF6879 family protein [Streptomonospora sp. DSM 45055]MDT0305025.1 hypothetical protein [Streptomonospora sp. DSM 45055]
MAHPVLDGLAKAQHSAVHLEMRDAYQPSDPEFIAWQSGKRLDPSADRESWWNPFLDIVAETTGRGVVMRRARIVSEPVTDYIKYEYDVTFPNVAAGELVRWLPRRNAADIALPGSDLWMFDDSTISFTYFSGVGEVVDREVRTEPEVLSLVRSAFEAVWARAVPHEEYKPA